MSLRETPILDVDEAVRRRRSVRAFLPDELPETLLREVFEIAGLAPSNCNAQPWAPHVVSGAALRRLREALLGAGTRDEPPNPDWPLAAGYFGVYRDRQIDAAQKLFGAMGIERRDMAGRKRAFLRNHVCFDAPHVAFLFMPEPFGAREAADVGMYAQTLMLALTARGVASCAQGALGLHPDIVRRELGVASNHKLLFGISFGYEDPNAAANSARVGRAAVEDAVRFHS